MSEKTLPGGNTVGAARIGDVVHKQASPCTPTVHALLRHLEDAGLSHVGSVTSWRPVRRRRDGSG